MLFEDVPLSSSRDALIKQIDNERGVPLSCTYYARVVYVRRAIVDSVHDSIH